MSSVFPGWTVVWATCASVAIVFGVSYSFAAFFHPLADEFAALRADVSMVFGLSSLLYFALGAPAGALSDRFGPRVTGIAGMLIIALGLAACTVATTLPQIYAAYGLGVGVGIALVYTPAMGAVQPWFVKHRGLASGIASAGIGAGTLLVPPITGLLCEHLGWRSAMLCLAALCAVAGVAAAACLDRDPARRGWLPDGVRLAPPTDRSDGTRAAAAAPAPATPTLAASAATGMTLRQAVHASVFHWLYLSTLAASPLMFMPFAHLSASARDHGLDESQTLWLISLIGIGSLVGRFVIGALADRLGRTITITLAQGVLAVSMLLWWGSETLLGFGVFAIVFGLSYGGIVSLMPPICSDLFGTRAVAGIIGVLYSGAAFGALIGPLMAGGLFDRFGSYAPAQMVGLALGLSATAASARMARMSRRAAS